MSHTATIKVAFTDRDILKAVCERLGLKHKTGSHTVNLYQGSVKCDFSVTLPGWNYPIAITGNKVKFDNYGGKWGKMNELERLQDQYSRDVAIQKAESCGMSYDEEIDETGEITLTLYDYS